MLLFLLCILTGLLFVFRDRLGGVREKLLVLKEKLGEGFEKLKELTQRAFEKFKAAVNSLLAQLSARISGNNASSTGTPGSNQNPGNQSPPVTSRG